MIIEKRKKKKKNKKKKVGNKNINIERNIRE